MNTPRNIIAIDRISANDIVGLRRISASSVQLSELTPWESVHIKVPARMTVSDKIEDGVRMFTVQLVFRTCDDMSERERKVYRCKTADGKYYLIGTDKRPYPITTVNESHPDNMNDNQLDEVTVSYTASSRIPFIQ